MKDALRVVAEITGNDTVSAHALSDGVFEVELADGVPVVAKCGPGPGATQAEAAGLEWLAVSDVIAVPAVRGLDEDWLVIEKIEPGPATPTAAERFGSDLAALHQAGANAFGSPPPGAPAEGWIGSTTMSYAPGDDWPEWYATQRIQPYLRKSVDSGTLTTHESTVVDAVCDRIEDLAGPAEPPSRLHGDLWSGNVHWAADGRVWLIDPAAHGGHRETDLAMLHLFGCPHLDRIVSAYLERTPLADGWRQRIALHQLFPLLVHTVLFGRSYAGQTVNAARQALRV